MMAWRSSPQLKRKTRIEAAVMARACCVPVDSFDAVLCYRQELSRRVLELESRHLQRFMRSVQA